MADGMVTSRRGSPVSAAGNSFTSTEDEVDLASSWSGVVVICDTAEPMTTSRVGAIEVMTWLQAGPRIWLPSVGIWLRPLHSGVAPPLAIWWRIDDTSTDRWTTLASA